MSGRVLLAGFAATARERHAMTLGSAGWQVLVGSGRQSVRVLAKSGTLAAVIVPRGKRGEEAAQWLKDVVPEVPRLALTRGHDPVALVAGESTGPVVVQSTPDASEPSPSSVVETPEPAALPMPKAPAPVPSRLGREDLEKKLTHVRFGNYFEALEVSADASAYVVRQQYQHLADLYCPSGWPGRLHPQEVALLDEIARGLHDAYMVLGESSTRERYGRALDSGRRNRR